MELKELHDKLISEGCNRFYIEGIGGPQFDDVERLSIRIADGKFFTLNVVKKVAPYSQLQ